MSNRVFRKLQGDDDIKKLSLDSSNNQENKLIVIQNRLPYNQFELLNSIDSNSNSDFESKEDEKNKLSTSQDELAKRESGSCTSNVTKLKKKRKKVKSNYKQIKYKLEDQKDDIETSLEIVNQILGKIETKPKSNLVESSITSNFKPLSAIHRYLNPENELRRIFGSKVIQAELLSNDKRKNRSRLNAFKSWILIVPRKFFKEKPPFTMELVSSNSENIRYFKFVHSKTYQSVQFQFLEAVESYNPENLINLHKLYPYHVETLLQSSNFCKMNEEVEMAADFIEKALIVFELVLHPLFNVTRANCRLDYCQLENRSFFITIFKHIYFIGQKGCNRTAFEFCKILLSLDPKGDPLCVLCMIDYYALRGKEYDYLIQLCEAWSDDNRLSLLPNIRFSVALAFFFKSQEAKSENFESLYKQSNHLLQQALIDFPNILLPLLDQCSVKPDEEVTKCKFFKPSSIPSSLTDLVSIFVGRSYSLWKDRSVMNWLESNVKEVIKLVDEDKNLEKRHRQNWNQFFNQSTPFNVLRHIILSGIPEAIAHLPWELKNNAIFEFDPLPPVDSICSYTRPKPTETNLLNEAGIVTTFFRSIWPNFNSIENDGQRLLQVNQRQPIAPVQNDDPTSATNLTISVTNLIDAMRNLLTSFENTNLLTEGDVESDENNSD